MVRKKDHCKSYPSINHFTNRWIDILVDLIYIRKIHGKVHFTSLFQQPNKWVQLLMRWQISRLDLYFEKKFKIKKFRVRSTLPRYYNSNCSFKSSDIFQYRCYVSNSYAYTITSKYNTKFIGYFLLVDECSTYQPIYVLRNMNKE